MPGMKRDCGGAAGVLGAFYVAVKNGFKDRLHCVLCLAENSVGPLATRPDDVHTMYSGKTVEINNTDAEGRLVLADGVAYAAKDLNCDVVLDMATLTGAQVRPADLLLRRLTVLSSEGNRHWTLPRLPPLQQSELGDGRVCGWQSVGRSLLPLCLLPGAPVSRV